MTRALLFLQVAALVLAVFAGGRFVRTLFVDVAPGGAAGEGAGKDAAVLSSPGSTLREGGDGRTKAGELYAGIIERNLFHDARKEGAGEVAPPRPASRKTPRPERRSKSVVLEGIIIVGDYRAAVIKDIGAKRRGARPSRRVQVGDAIGD
ncbi:MAG: hypothetical protein V3W31_07985, partial [Thermodesulfobacteriota bacterium]